MKKTILFLLFSLFALLAMSQPTINAVKQIKPGANNTVLATNGSGQVAWLANSVIAPIQSVVSGSNINAVVASGVLTITNTAPAQTLSIAGQNLSISGGNSVTLPTLTEVDGSVTNEIQTISLAGQVLTLSLSGGSVTIPDKSLQYVGEVAITTAGSTATVSGITATADTDVWVFRNGVKQTIGAGKNLTRSGTTLTFAASLEVGESIEVFERK